METNKIRKENVEGINGLTPIQKGLLFHYIAQLDSELYLCQFSIRLTGLPSESILIQSIQFVVNSNSSLRSVFRWKELSEPIQIIMKEHECNIEVYDCTSFTESSQDEFIQELKREDRKKGFDLEIIPIKFAIIKLINGDMDLLVSYHHIIADGWSNTVILKELLEACETIIEGKNIRQTKKASYASYVRYLKQLDAIENEKYWTNQLKSCSFQGLIASKDVNRADGVESVSYRVKDAMFQQQSLLLKKNGLTIADLYYSAWAVLLERYCDISDVVFGTTVSCRPYELIGIEDVVGLFVNTIPLRIDISHHQTCIDLIKTIDRIQREREEYKYYSLADIKRCSSFKNKENIFDTIVVVENYPSYDADCNSKVKIIQCHEWEKTDYHIVVQVVQQDHELEVKLNYNTRYFEKDYIEAMMVHYINIVNGMINIPMNNVQKIEMLSEREKGYIANVLNDSDCEYPYDETIVSLYQKQTLLHFEDIAIMIDDTAMTYGDLDKKSDVVASILIKHGVIKDTIVAVMIDRSIRMMVALIGILKAGGAYMPISLGYPKERVEYMLEDSRSSIVLIDGADKITKKSDITYIDLQTIDYAWEDSMSSINRAEADGLSYIIYTSGSTGKPKGVMIEHRSVVNRLNWMQKRYPINSSDTILQKTPTTFDVSVWELFWWSITGARLCLLPPNEEKNPQTISDCIEKYKITTIHFVPTMFSIFMEYVKEWGLIHKLRTLNQVFCSGEALKPSHVVMFNKTLKAENSTKLINLYGPTEATVDVSYYDCLDGDDIEVVPIGKPIDNIKLYVLDRKLRVLPKGIIGELYIAGIGLARGYLNRKQLEEERYIRNPWLENERMYKTGDLARILSDGNIEYLGRKDNQVKIRGCRIELGEIENTLVECERVSEAAVLAKDDGQGSNYLCAYIVASNKISVSELKTFLAERLPDYMIPSSYVFLDELPVNNNGKTDRNRLRDIEDKKTDIDTDDMSVLEEKISDIWRDVLKRNVSVNENFFDIGGHSLSLIQVNSRIKKELHKDISVTEMFSYPTVRALAKQLSKEEADERVKVSTVDGNVTDPIQHDIAIIGMAVRFPMAKDKQEYWDMLVGEKESIRFMTKEECAQKVPKSLLDHPDYVRAGGVFEDCYMFDAEFFHINAREAEMLDPQQRVFLETAYEALEDAGYSPQKYKGSLGIYASSSMSSYLVEILQNRQLVKNLDRYQLMVANDKDFLATRAAYKLNLEGPAFTVQSACSSSLAGVHLACKSLRNDECDMILVGGVSIEVPQGKGYLYKEGGILSKTGHCRAFDNDADGTVGGNGACVIALKRLDKAMNDRDNIYAVVKGSALNNDGSNKMGFTVPSIEGQKKVIQSALFDAGLKFEDIDYIETHGTGTKLGDPIEASALLKVYEESDKKNTSCLLGSVKTNIGHLDVAAGMAGMIKTVLSLKYGFIPASINYTKLNDKINFEHSPFEVNTKLTEWKSDKTRRAGVSSFGLGGTNAHVILEEAPKRVCVSERMDYELIILSARTVSTLNKERHNLSKYLNENKSLRLSDTAYTLAVGRNDFETRGMLVAGNEEDAIKMLSEDKEGFVSYRIEEQSGIPNILFVFDGQGSQYINMGIELYHMVSTFKRYIDECTEAIKRITQVDILSIMFPADGISDRNESLLRQTRNSQLAIFAIEYAAACMLMKWGIKPSAMIGHSIGEYVAAYVSGVLSLEDAIKLVNKRGQLMQSMKHGKMMTVFCSEAEIEAYLNENISLAVVNSKNTCVLAGEEEHIMCLQKMLNERGIKNKVLHTSHAFHSHMMEPIVKEFQEFASYIKFGKTEIPYISSASGDWITNEEASNPLYWGEHIRHTVRFSDGLTNILKQKDYMVVELGPGNSLQSLIMQHGAKKIVSLLSMNKIKSEYEYFLCSIGRLWMWGYPVDWEKFYSGTLRHRVSLPTYPFEHTEYNLLHDMDDSQKETSNRVDDWIYIESFQRDHNPVPVQNHAKKSFIVFEDKYCIGNKVSEALLKQGHTVIEINEETEFREIGNMQYTLNPKSKEDFGRLFAELIKKNIYPDKIIFAWNLDVSRSKNSTYEIYLQSLYMVQTLIEYFQNQKVELYFLSASMYDIIGTENIESDMAVVNGVCKVISQEYKDITSICIDIVRPEDNHALDVITKNMLDEICNESKNNFVAYRGENRWIPQYYNCKFQQSTPVFQIKKGGVYLLTGGLGNVGLTLAHYLAMEYQAKLILTSRHGFASRDEWYKYRAEKSEKDKEYIVADSLLDIERLGSEVYVVKADITEHVSMMRQVEDAYEHFGALDGIFHLAGVSGEDALCTITDTDFERFETITKAKIKGTKVVEEILRKFSPSFCFLCSSLSSILGGLGFSAYASGNAYMNAAAQVLKKQMNIPVISVCFDAWEMRKDIYGISQSRTGLHSIPYSRSNELYHYIFKSCVHQNLFVSLSDLNQRINTWSNLGKTQESDIGCERKLYKRPTLQNEYIEPIEEVEQEIADIWKDTLGVDRVGANDNFFELGGDSLIGIDLCEILRNRFGADISVLTLYEAPTIAEIARIVRRDKKDDYLEKMLNRGRKRKSRTNRMGKVQ